jgi:hypothetical protein
MSEQKFRDLPDDSAEFRAFSQSEPIAPPPVIHDHLRRVVARDLSPSLFGITSKVAGAHLIAALVSLAICPQFGIGPFGGDAGLMAFLMSWGWMACAAGCGAVFMMGTGILSAVVLSPDEKRVLAPHSPWIFTSLSSASWAVFMMAMATEASSGHSGHHASLNASPDAFSMAWSAVWVVAATLSAMGAFAAVAMLSCSLQRSPSTQRS